MCLFFRCSTSVSYTHLDVYKRQGFGNGGEFGGGGASGSWPSAEDITPDVAEASEGLLEGAGEALGNAAEAVGDTIGDCLLYTSRCV